ncbi:hypothetical protein P9112_012989 [Eukaryota sp. TZLM1-RC]
MAVKDLSPRKRFLLRSSTVIVLIAALIFVLSRLNNFHLPGVAMVNYKQGERIPLWMSTITSNVTQIPFDYYALPVCKPEKITEDRRNLGDLLLGHVRQSSDYQVFMNQPDSNAKELCSKDLTGKQLKTLRNHITQRYRVNWILDNLSVFVKIGPSLYEQGFPLGRTEIEDGKHRVLLHNHQLIKVLYHTAKKGDGKEKPMESRVVGFEVDYLSIDWIDSGADISNHRITNSESILMGPYKSLYLSSEKETPKVVWSYQVEFIESDISWKSRWDNYFYQAHTQFQWFSIIHALLIVFFLTSMVGMILAKTLKSDLFRYSNPDLDDYQEDYGWKMIRGDVFRAPANPSLFSSCIGSGVQVGIMIGSSLLFALLGFLSPAHRGSLLTSLVVFFVLGSYAAGYTSARIYKNFNGKHWKRTTLRTALLFPGFVFIVWFFTDLLLTAQGSTQAVPFAMLLLLALVYFGISVPLTYVGSFHGYSIPKVEPPVKVNQIPREIPDQPWWCKPVLVLPMAGIIPFSAVFIEVYFILTSVTSVTLFYMFGFLTIVFLIFVVTCVEISISLSYFAFCAENYRNWQWKSFFYPASSAIYFFLYALYFLVSSLDLVKLASTVTYLCYVSIVTVAFGLLAGTLGYIGTHVFTVKVFSVKMD